jgi:hypothetical protein
MMLMENRGGRNGKNRSLRTHFVPQMQKGHPDEIPLEQFIYLRWFETA